jgi:SAM-dependent methyltransferase
MTEPTGTWHYGLIARWWAEFNDVEPRELEYFAGAIERFGQPALDIGCGTGRVLIPLLARGLDVDGVDISPDMLALAKAAATRAGRTPRLTAQAAHELDLPRTYRTVYMCGTFGIGGRRDRDLEALRRIHRHLEPGGGLVFDLEMPYNGLDETGWSRWLAGHREDLPRPWRETGDRRRSSDGDEIELINRLGALDPLHQVERLEIRARRWHDGEVVAEEEGVLLFNLYFAQEVVGLLAASGFVDVAVEGKYTGRPATEDEGDLVFVARRGVD